MGNGEGRRVRKRGRRKGRREGENEGGKRRRERRGKSVALVIYNTTKSDQISAF